MLDKVPELDGAEIDDVICGAASEGGEQAMNLGRLIGALAGLPETVPGTTVNRFCASSLQAIRMAYHAIVAGEGDTYVAAGVECVSRVAGRDFEEGDKNVRFVDSSQPDFVNHIYIPMGLTAENVAERWGVDRADMDEYAVRSHERALAAQASGFFDAEVTPVPLPDGGEMTRDECPRPGTTVRAARRPQACIQTRWASHRRQRVPAQRRSGGHPRDVAGARGGARLRPRVRIIASAVTGLAPEIMGVGPIQAVGKVLDAAGMTIRDVDIVELNEAFASQVLAVCRELEVDIDAQLNPFGGALALGHPFGMTGARIMTTLIHGLEERDQTIGLETMCIGGGQGMAMLVERI